MTDSSCKTCRWWLASTGSDAHDGMGQCFRFVSQQAKATEPLATRYSHRCAEWLHA